MSFAPKASPAIKPRDDPRQGILLRRYFMAAGTSGLVLALVLACYLQGVLARGPFLLIAAAIVAWVLAFYIAFRTGLNLRFRDPSLTLPQVAAATLTMLYALYAADAGRPVFLILIFMIFLFGVLQLAARTLLVFALSILIGYLAVIALVWRFKPETLDLRLETLQWLALAVTLPWFASMGGYVSRLRDRLKKNNARLKAALEEAAASEANLAEAQRIAGLGSWSYDPAARVAHWSPETYRIFGLDPAQPAPVGQAFLALVHAEERAQYQQLIRAALRDGHNFDSQFRIVLPDGELRWVHALGRPAVDAGGRTTFLRGTSMDVTERKSAEERIRELAHFDSLTGLPTRNLFNHLLEHSFTKAVRRRTPLALLFIDLDGFKRINDTFGHEAGDRLLVLFAQRLRTCLRKSDATARLRRAATAARLGGDEFVVLIDDFREPADLAVVAQRILASAAEPFPLEGQEGCVSASIGISVYPHDGNDADSLLKSADSAMYRTKQAGKNDYQFVSPPASQTAG